jgi:hypothetical protein
MTRTRKTRDLCQPCWYDDNPDLYFPDGNRYGTCAVCGADTLVHRSSIPDRGPFADMDLDCGPVVNPDGTPTAMTRHVLRGDDADLPAPTGNPAGLRDCACCGMAHYRTADGTCLYCAGATRICCRS